ADVPEAAELPGLFPFSEEQVERVARTEPTLRDMLQQYRHLFDHLVYGEAPVLPLAEPQVRPLPEGRQGDHETGRQGDQETAEGPAVVTSVVVVETPATGDADPSSVSLSPCLPVSLSGLWEQELRAARRKLEPEGALTGATRELQMGLGAFLQACHE